MSEDDTRKRRKSSERTSETYASADAPYSEAAPPASTRAPPSGTARSAAASGTAPEGSYGVNDAYVEEPGSRGGRSTAAPSASVVRSTPAGTRTAASGSRAAGAPSATAGSRTYTTGDTIGTEGGGGGSTAAGGSRTAASASRATGAATGYGSQPYSAYNGEPEGSQAVPRTAPSGSAVRSTAGGASARQTGAAPPSNRVDSGQPTSETWPTTRPSQKKPTEPGTNKYGSDGNPSMFFQRRETNPESRGGTQARSQGVVQSGATPRSQGPTQASQAQSTMRGTKGGQALSKGGGQSMQGPRDPSGQSEMSQGQLSQGQMSDGQISGGGQRPSGGGQESIKSGAGGQTDQGQGSFNGGQGTIDGGQGPSKVGPPGQSDGGQGPSGGGGRKVRRKPKRCPVHVEHDVLFHCHACDLDICKLCWKLGHTGTSERHHDVVFIEFMKQKEFAEQLDNFNLDERLVEIDYQSKLCEKTGSHLKNLVEKLLKERSILKEETAVCDTLIMKYGKLQAMARAQNFDHTNKDVVQFMALTDNPYDTREPIMSEEDKEALEAIIDQLQHLVLERSPESSAAISVAPTDNSFA